MQISLEAYTDMFISFIEYKETYISFFNSNLQQRIRGIKKNKNRKEVKKKVHTLYLHYISNFYNSYFLIEMYSYDKDKATQWINDIRKGCILSCQEVLRKNHIIK